MMSLSDVTLYPFITTLKEPAKTNSDVARIYSFLVKNKVMDYKRLEDLITRGHPMADTKDFNRMLLKASTCIDTINSFRREENNVSLEKRPIIEHKKAIMITDKTTKLGEVIITNPTEVAEITNKLMWCSMQTARYLIRKINPNGDNALAAMTPSLGNYRVKQLADAFKLYDEQLVRVARTVSPDYEGNLFFKDKAEKERLILEEIHEIIDYLMHNGDDYIFGNITVNMIDIFARIAKLPTSCDHKVRDRLINILANYVTLEEAQEGLVRTRAIDRFIIK